MQRRSCQDSSPFWLANAVRIILFSAIVLTIAGAYAAFRVPISVFPDTNFPRVVIGVDNGVMPVEQMQVTVTKPIEDAPTSRTLATHFHCREQAYALVERSMSGHMDICPAKRRYRKRQVLTTVRLVTRGSERRGERSSAPTKLSGFGKQAATTHLTFAA